MTKKNPTHVAHCQCGAVEVGAWGEPIIVNACYCDDCQEAAQRFAASANLPPVSSADGGTEFMLLRRDRIACTRGADRLQAMRLTDASKTRRMITGCCTMPMYLAFDDKRPWVSAFRASFVLAFLNLAVLTRVRPRPAVKSQRLGPTQHLRILPTADGPQSQRRLLFG